jgi:hypothetical protein
MGPANEQSGGERIWKGAHSVLALAEFLLTNGPSCLSGSSGYSMGSPLSIAPECYNHFQVCVFLQQSDVTAKRHEKLVRGCRNLDLHYNEIYEVPCLAWICRLAFSRGAELPQYNKWGNIGARLAMA